MGKTLFNKILSEAVHSAKFRAAFCYVTWKNKARVPLNIFSPFVSTTVCSFVCLATEISVYSVCNKVLSVVPKAGLEVMSLERKEVKRHCVVYYFKLCVD